MADLHVVSNETPTPIIPKNGLCISVIVPNNLDNCHINPTQSMKFSVDLYSAVARCINHFTISVCLIKELSLRAIPATEDAHTASCSGGPKVGNCALVCSAVENALFRKPELV